MHPWPSIRRSFFPTQFARMLHHGKSARFFFFFFFFSRFEVTSYKSKVPKLRRTVVLSAMAVGDDGVPCHVAETSRLLENCENSCGISPWLGSVPGPRSAEDCGQVSCDQESSCSESRHVAEDSQNLFHHTARSSANLHGTSDTRTLLCSVAISGQGSSLIGPEMLLGSCPGGERCGGGAFPPDFQDPKVQRYMKAWCSAHSPALFPAFG